MLTERTGAQEQSATKNHCLLSLVFSAGCPRPPLSLALLIQVNPSTGFITVSLWSKPALSLREAYWFLCWVSWNTSRSSYNMVHLYISFLLWFTFWNVDYYTTEKFCCKYFSSKLEIVCRAHFSYVKWNILMLQVSYWRATSHLNLHDKFCGLA